MHSNFSLHHMLSNIISLTVELLFHLSRMAIPLLVRWGHWNDFDARVNPVASRRELEMVRVCDIDIIIFFCSKRNPETIGWRGGCHYGSFKFPASISFSWEGVGGWRCAICWFVHWKAIKVEICVCVPPKAIKEAFIFVCPFLPLTRFG